MTRGRKPTTKQKEVNWWHSLRPVGSAGSTGSKVRAPSNGHCPQSPVDAHWWLIETPHGRTSPGVCKYCKEEREFLNWIGEEFKE